MLIANQIDQLHLDMSGGRTTMDQITEHLLSLFSSEYEITHLEESKRFETFAAHLIVGEEQPESFDPNEIVVSDGKDKAGNQTQDGGDTGIDAIAIIANDNLLIDLDDFVQLDGEAKALKVQFIFIQAETSSNFDGHKMQNFASGVADFFRPQPLLKRNNKVAQVAEIKDAIFQKIPKFKYGNPDCKLFYVTTGKVYPDTTLEAHITVAKSNLDATGLFGEISFTRIGAEGVQRLYHQSKNAESATFEFAHKVTIKGGIAGVSEAYSGYLPWLEFKKLIVNEADSIRRSLFFDNVRDWQEFNPVNTDIRDTLQSATKNRFVLMNNGVTVIAKQMKHTGDTFVLDDYQIVNGCQTSHVLYNERASLDDSVLIPFRLIGTMDEEVTKAIIKATNRQTPVTEDQFFALDEFGKRLEVFFGTYPIAQKLYFERRSNQYKAVEDIKQVRVVTFANMIRDFASMFLNEPHRATRNYAGLKAKVGSDIFSEQHRMEPYYISAFTHYKVNALFRSTKLAAKFKPAAFHLLLAFRILAAGWEMPAITANKMEAYCEGLKNILHDPSKCDEVLALAADIIDNAAAGDFNRDSIRKEGFTVKVIELAKTERAKDGNK